MSRLWVQGLPLTVASDAYGTPEVLVLARRHERVVAVIVRWRVKQRWWQRRVWREYFVLATANYLLLLVYHELPDGPWRLALLFD
jgi:hypothetical protein